MTHVLYLVLFADKLNTRTSSWPGSWELGCSWRGWGWFAAGPIDQGAGAFAPCTLAQLYFASLEVPAFNK